MDAVALQEVCVDGENRADELARLMSAASGRVYRASFVQTHAAGGVTPDAPAPYQVNLYLARLLEGCALRLDRAHSAGHWWLDEAQAPSLLLGIEPHLLRVLQPVDEVVTPPAGTWLRRPEACGWLRRGHLSIPLHAPISGEVDRVNPRYLLAARAPRTFSDEWLLRVTPHEDPGTVPGLLRGADALAWHLETLRRLQSAVAEMVEGPPDLEDGQRVAIAAAE